ncbi:MAG: hypothetical protein WKG07_12080 [Hymenobacter sp.]
MNVGGRLRGPARRPAAGHPHRARLCPRRAPDAAAGRGASLGCRRPPGHGARLAPALTIPPFDCRFAMTHAPGFLTTARIGPELLTEADLRHAELARARHALAYLKAKLGNEALRELLKEDLAAITARVQEWVGASRGAGQTGLVELAVPGSCRRRFSTSGTPPCWPTTARRRRGPATPSIL